MFCELSSCDQLIFFDISIILIKYISERILKKFKIKLTFEITFGLRYLIGCLLHIVEIVVSFIAENELLNAFNTRNQTHITLQNQTHESTHYIYIGAVVMIYTIYVAFCLLVLFACSMLVYIGFAWYKRDLKRPFDKFKRCRLSFILSVVFKVISLWVTLLLHSKIKIKLYS